MTNSRANKLNLLFAGRCEEALTGSGERNFRVCVNMVDAVAASAEGDYDVIAVVARQCHGHMEQVLRTMRQSQPRARIVVLSPMWLEPAVRKLLKSSHPDGVVDDYLITPADMDSFAQAVGMVDNEPGDAPSRPRADGEDNLKARIALLEKMATEDDLTGLKNRRYVREFADQVVARAAELDLTVTLLIFDIDNFKHYNDRYGHGAGDEVLIQAGKLMKRCCRDHDIVARIGGDEFAVVFWDNPSDTSEGGKSERRRKGKPPREAVFIAERFRNEVSKAEFPMLGPEAKGVLSISGGLASFPRDVDNAQSLFDKADKALLEAKRSGKNRIYLVGEPEKAR